MTNMSTKLIGANEGKVFKEFEHRIGWVCTGRGSDHWEIANWMTAQKLAVKFDVFGTIIEYHWN